MLESCGWERGDQSQELIETSPCASPAPPVCGRVQVDNMHYELYKQLKLCSEERERLVGFWMRRERHKRQLDADMSAARTKLAALPSDIPPPEFLSHLNTLIVTPSTGLHTGTGPTSQYPHFSSCTLLHHPYGAPPPLHIPAAVRFMGQYPKDIVRAEKLLLGLRNVMKAIQDLHVDVLNAEMPGVLLEVEKCHKLWSDLLLTQKMAPDFVEVCQIAAIQQNRCSLFQDPFPYSFQQRRI